jgi:hypothetical protein
MGEAKRTVYRVQDAEGRGPWRPGFSRHWIDADGPPLPPALHDDFGVSIYRTIKKANGHCGSACDSLEKLAVWFTQLEQLRLRLLGYRPVCILADEILAESEHQIVIRCDRPLTDAALLLPWSALEVKAHA